MKEVEILAKNLTCHGYGSDYNEIYRILSKLTAEEISNLTYNLYRTSEKCGMDAFDCDELFKW